MKENCKHKKYSTTHKMVVVKLAELESWQLVLKLSVSCMECGRMFTFRAPHGFSTKEPTIGNSEAELYVPVDYPSAEEDVVPPPPTDKMVH